MADQISLIISDTGKGQESIVASGLTYPMPSDAPRAASVIARYELEKSLPISILRAIDQPNALPAGIPQYGLRAHHLLLDNECALEAAAHQARKLGFAVEIAHDITEQPIEEGCAAMLSRLSELRSSEEESKKRVCLISGGEFSCPVRGKGKGGRNAETALRCAIKIDEEIRRDETGVHFQQLAILSAGTDGIDGNSPAAGALADSATLRRARQMQMDVRSFLEQSDSYGFFAALGDAVRTGATGTNVRDIRIMLAL